MIRVGKSSARVTARARILLKSDDGWAAPLNSDVAGTVYRIKQHFTEEGIGRGPCGTGDRPTGIDEVGRPGRGAPGRAWPAAQRQRAMTTGPCACWLERWWNWGWRPPCPTMGVSKAAQKNALKPWQKKEWCIPKVSAEFVANMEDVLDLYAEPYDPQLPVVCFDETSTQLLAETRPPTAAPSRDAPAAAGLRVPPRGHSKPVPSLRAAGRMAAGGSDPAAHDAGLRPSDALAGG